MVSKLRNFLCSHGALSALLLFIFFSHVITCEAQAIIPKKQSSRVKGSRRVILRKAPVPFVKGLPAAAAAKDRAAAGSRNNSFLIQEVPKERPVAPETSVTFQASGSPMLESVGALSYVDDANSSAVDKNGNKIFFTLIPDLQIKARSLLERYALPWGAIVAVEPRTGKILALASYSTRDPNGPDIATRATFPAASLFKLITASAAIEKSGMSGSDLIFFRGGNYTLERFNYLPDQRRDTRSISFADALGRSINPAFGRVALNNLSSVTLERYANNFGFNFPLPFDGPVDVSHFTRPEDDYETARTAAGFGDVTLSPLHAAVIAATIANNGVMMRPYVVDHIMDSAGLLKYQARSSAVRTAIASSTSKELMNMMQATVDTGTARKQFLKVQNPFLKNATIAAKTGTLSGDNPKGTYHWFVAAVPAEKPEIAICTLVIDPGNARIRVKSSGLARELLEHFFRDRSAGIQTRRESKDLRS